jgi:hypothetical protein
VIRVRRRWSPPGGSGYHPCPSASRDYFTVGIRRCHDAGKTSLVRVTLTIHAAFFDRFGRYESAATIAGFAITPFAAAAAPEIDAATAHLRDVLGDQTYASLAHKGAAMTTADMAAYAYDQIDQARGELSAVSE